MNRKNIILCGFMGCGKSTVGTLLAKKAGMSFVDLDTYIEKKENKTVSEIFAENGEAYFRQAERKAAEELSQKKGLVIAAGGGTLVYKENEETLRKTGKVVLLDIPVEKVAERLKNDTTRPLLNRPDKEKAMKELYESRMPVYRAAADYTVDADNSPMKVCMDILSAVM